MRTGVGRVALIAGAFAAGCSVIDDREPTISDGDGLRPMVSTVPSLPSPGSGGSSGNPATPGNPALAGAAGSSAQPGSPSTAPPGPAPAPSAECAAGNNARCTTPSGRPGACAQPGQCIELCVVGVSRAGACLVQPGGG